MIEHLKINNFEKFVKDTKNKETINEDGNLKYIDHGKVEEIQKQKQELMMEMHEKFIEIDSLENGQQVGFESKNSKTIFSDEEGLFFRKKNEKIRVTKGQVMAASIWENNLKIDGTVTKSFAKDFILKETKDRISRLWDNQLHEGIKSMSTSTHQEAAERVLENNEKKIDSFDTEKVTENGILVERMIESIFTKLNYDIPDLPFEFQKGTIYDDVVQVVDFKFKIKEDYMRSLNIELCGKSQESCDFSADIGVQYANSSKEYSGKKENQVKKARRNMEQIDDIVLVSMKVQGIRDAMNEWKNNSSKKSIDGPDLFLSESVKEKLFKSILENLPENLGIDPQEYWEKAKGKF